MVDDDFFDNNACNDSAFEDDDTGLERLLELKDMAKVLASQSLKRGYFISGYTESESKEFEFHCYLWLTDLYTKEVPETISNRIEVIVAQSISTEHLDAFYTLCLQLIQHSYHSDSQGSETNIHRLPIFSNQRY